MGAAEERGWIASSLRVESWLPRLKPRLGYLSLKRRAIRVALATVGSAEPRVYPWSFRDWATPVRACYSDRSTLTGWVEYPISNIRYPISKKEFGIHLELG